MKILILGGYGTFGGRLAQSLADLDCLHLVIAGRSEAKAKAFCAAFEGRAAVTALQLERDQGARLAGLALDLVVDASGPFQTYGDEPYGFIRAAIAAGVPYLDLADGADFVRGIASLDTAARAAGVFALSGVSSFPVLTAAVVRALAPEGGVTKVTAGIAPSPFAGVGLNVMRAVVGYAGEPVKLWRCGKAAEAPGLAESLRYTVAPPGRLPLRSTRFSLVEVPELQLLPDELPDLQDIWVGAGPVPEVLHVALNGLAKMRARHALPNLAPASAFFYWVLNRMRFGEHRGGMFVEVEVGDEQRSWHMLAEGDDGPIIPVMAVEVLVRKMLSGDQPEPGARAATRALELADYDDAFAGRKIFQGRRRVEHGPLYRRVLGLAFEDLPAAVRDLHDVSTERRWQGRAQVRRARGLLARVFGWTLGLPPAAEDVPVDLTFTPFEGGERWERRFGDHALRSVQREGRGRSVHLIDESFGPVTVSLALVRDGDKLLVIPRRCRVLGIPVPGFLLPGGDTYETGEGARFRFHVEFVVPVIGWIATYEGWLEAE